MNVTAYKTHKIQPNENLYEILDRYLPPLQEKNIVILASKIVGICEGRVIKKDSDEQKETLIKQEADYYLPQHHKGFLLTIKNGLVVANGGVDESNSNGYLSLWPKDPQKSADAIREYLVKKHQLDFLGIIITDSKLTLLRHGVTAYGLAHSGFQALTSYVNKGDIYGNILNTEKINNSDSLATAAAIVMGEGNEQQPLAIITDLPFIHFQQRNPTKKELGELRMHPKDDLFGSLFNAVAWYKKQSE